MISSLPVFNPSLLPLTIPENKVPLISYSSIEIFNQFSQISNLSLREHQDLAYKIKQLNDLEEHIKGAKSYQKTANLFNLFGAGLLTACVALMALGFIRKQAGLIFGPLVLSLYPLSYLLMASDHSSNSCQTISQEEAKISATQSEIISTHTALKNYFFALRDHNFFSKIDEKILKLRTSLQKLHADYPGLFESENLKIDAHIAELQTAQAELTHLIAFYEAAKIKAPQTE